MGIDGAVRRKCVNRGRGVEACWGNNTLIIFTKTKISDSNYAAGFDLFWNYPTLYDFTYMQQNRADICSWNVWNMKNGLG